MGPQTLEGTVSTPGGQCLDAPSSLRWCSSTPEISNSVTRCCRSAYLPPPRAVSTLLDRHPSRPSLQSPRAGGLRNGYVVALNHSYFCVSRPPGASGWVGAWAWVTGGDIAGEGARGRGTTCPPLRRGVRLGEAGHPPACPGGGGGGRLLLGCGLRGAGRGRGAEGEAPGSAAPPLLLRRPPPAPVMCSGRHTPAL